MLSNELMYMNWQKMIKPEKVQVTSSPIYGRLVCEPLDRGFGITIGNALRRIMLSSLYGAAIVSVRFAEVVHEFSAIPGVVEDVSEIILNLKEVRFKLPEVQSINIYIDAEGEGEVTAGHIKCEEGFCEILNPDLHIATLSGESKLKMFMSVKVSKGYSLSENNKVTDAPSGTIPIDAVFSPVKRVAYTVDSARVAQNTDYDKLTMEIWTDGSIVPEDAIAYAAKIFKEQMNIFINFDENLEPESEVVVTEPEKIKFNENLYRLVDELELSVRSANCLKNANILKIYQLVRRTESEMLKTKNFGRKSLNEIKEVLNEMGLSLGMKLDGFAVPEDDLEEGEQAFI